MKLQTPLLFGRWRLSWARPAWPSLWGFGWRRLWWRIWLFDQRIEAHLLDEYALMLFNIRRLYGESNEAFRARLREAMMMPRRGGA